MALTIFIAACALAVAPVTNPLASQRPDTALLFTGVPERITPAVLVEELAIGGERGPAEYGFSNAFVHVGRDGSVYIVDWLGDAFTLTHAVVRKYDRNGRFVRVFGRSGQGPGEYHGVVRDVKELPDGRVLISDGLGILVYRETGEPIARWSAKASSTLWGSQILVDPTGFVLTYGAEIGPGLAPGNANGRTPILYRFRFDGTLVDTIAPPDASLPDPSRMDRVRVPFVPIYHTAWSPLGYFVTSYSATYAVDLPLRKQFGASGADWRRDNPVASIRRPVQPVRVPDAERDDWRNSLTMFMRSGGGQSINWQWTGPEIPRVKPPIRDLFVAADGRIWVRLSQPSRLNPAVGIPTRPATSNEAYDIDARFRWVEPMVYDVYEPSGRFVGHVRLPDSVGHPRFSVDLDQFAAAGDTLWTVEYDADEVPRVKRYRIKWGG